MQSQSWTMLRILLNHYHRGSLDMILSPLAKNAQEVKNIQTSADNPALGIRQPQELVKSIHYSWFVPEIQKQPEFLQPIFVSAFPDPHFSKLRTLLNTPVQPLSLAPFVKAFIMNTLYSCFENSPLPKDFLSKTPLSPLLEFTKDDLVELINFLGLYDLSAEIRHIIDKNILQKLYSCLSSKKQQFLRICLHQKEKISTSSLELQKWDGNSKTLEDLLHKRGILRLGKSLSGEQSDFLWHVVHTLDTGRGVVLTKHFSKKEAPDVTSALIQQVIGVINFLKKASAL